MKDLKLQGGVPRSTGTDAQDVADLVSLTGAAVNSTNLGSFTGNTIPDNSTIKSAIQALETEVENKFINLLAGEVISQGDALYISTGTGDDSLRTAGRLYKLDVTSDDRFVFAGFATNNAGVGNNVIVQTSGRFQFTHGGAAGETLYADDTLAGAMTNVAPTTVGIWSTVLGIAVDSNKLVICNIGSTSSVYLEKNQGTSTIANNSSGNVTDLAFNSSEVRAFMVHYSVRRSTNSAKADESGIIVGVYNYSTLDWMITVGMVVGVGGMTFDITNLGQVTYTSSNLTGTSYTGNMKFTIVSTTEV